MSCGLWDSGIISTNKDTFMSLASSQISFNSCQKGLRKMRLHLPGNCFIFITLNANPLRRQGQRCPGGECSGGWWERTALESQPWHCHSCSQQKSTGTRWTHGDASQLPTTSEISHMTLDKPVNLPSLPFSFCQMK